MKQATATVVNSPANDWHPSAFSISSKTDARPYAIHNFASKDLGTPPVALFEDRVDFICGQRVSYARTLCWEKATSHTRATELGHMANRAKQCPWLPEMPTRRRTGGSCSALFDGRPCNVL